MRVVGQAAGVFLGKAALGFSSRQDLHCKISVCMVLGAVYILVSTLPVSR